MQYFQSPLLNDLNVTVLFSSSQLLLLWISLIGVTYVGRNSTGSTIHQKGGQLKEPVTR